LILCLQNLRFCCLRY